MVNKFIVLFSLCVFNVMGTDNNKLIELEKKNEHLSMIVRCLISDKEAMAKEIHRLRGLLNLNVDEEESNYEIAACQD